MLAPGALLLGNPGTCFECGHEHGVGDRCLSFHYTPEFLEGVVADVPGARRLGFGAPHLPPSLRSPRCVAGAEAAREAAMRPSSRRSRSACRGRAQPSLAGDRKPTLAPSAATSGASPRPCGASKRRRRAAISLGDLAGEAATQPVSFPAQFPPRRRHDALPVRAADPPAPRRRAAAHYRTSAVSAIAFDAGFNDLSTFNRRFRRGDGRAERLSRPPQGLVQGPETRHSRAAVGAPSALSDALRFDNRPYLIEIVMAENQLLEKRVLRLENRRPLSYISRQ